MLARAIARPVEWAGLPTTRHGSPPRPGGRTTAGPAMSHSPAPFPPPEEGLSLHLRLCALEADAPADACRAYLAPLLAFLAAKFPNVDPAARLTAVDDALFNYFEKPSAYDPERGDLATYLRMAACADLWNCLRAERRHHRGRVAWSVVELDEDAGNLSGREEEPPVQLER